MTIDCDNKVGKVILFVMECLAQVITALDSTQRMFKQSHPLNGAQSVQHAFLAMIEEIKPAASALMTTIS